MLKGPKRSFVVLGVESSKEIVPNETKSGHEEDLFHNEQKAVVRRFQVRAQSGRTIFIFHIQQ